MTYKMLRYLAVGVLTLAATNTFVVQADIPERDSSISSEAWQDLGLIKADRVAIEEDIIKENLKKYKIQLPEVMVKANAVYGAADTTIVRLPLDRNNKNLDNYRVSIPGRLATYVVDYDLTTRDKDGKLTIQPGNHPDYAYRFTTISTNSGFYNIESSQLDKRKRVEPFLNRSYDSLTNQDILQSVTTSIAEKSAHRKVSDSGRVTYKEEVLGAGKLLPSTPGTQYPTWDRTLFSMAVSDLDKKHPSIQVQEDTLTGNMYWNNENTYYVIASTNKKMEVLGQKGGEKAQNYRGHKSLANYVLPSFRPATEGLDGLKQEEFKPAISGKDRSDVKSISYYLPSFMKDVEGQTGWSGNRLVRKHISDKNQIYRVESIYIPGGVRSYFAASKAVQYVRAIMASGLEIERLEQVVINDVPGFYYEAVLPQTQKKYMASLLLFPLQSDEMVVITYDAPTKPSQEVASEIRRVIESTQLERYEEILKTGTRVIYEGWL